MASKDSKQSKTTPEVWEERYSQAAGNQAKMFQRFSNWYDSLYAIVGTTSSPWRSKIYVPILARQTWSLVSKFLNLKPGFEVRVQSQNTFGDEDLEAKAEKAQRKLEYDYNNPYLDESMRDKLFAPLLDATVTGTGIAKVCWKVEKKDRYERIIGKDGTVDLTKEKKTTKVVSYNDLEPVNIFNVYVSPSATNLYDAPWIIIKEFKSLSELKKVNESQGVEIYKNLDKLDGTASYDDDDNALNQSRNRLVNQTDKIDKTVKMVKLFECYEGDTICTYAESGESDTEQGWLLIREQKNPYWHGKYPLVRFCVKNKPYQFWGEGMFETTYRLQAAYNDVFNHYMDQWNLAENSMLIVPERANVNDYVVEPGGVITFRGDQAPQQFKHSEPNPNSLQAILQLMDQAVEGVTISNYASGIANSASDKTKGTATGILKLQEAAGDLVAFMRTNFQQSITQIGRMWLSNNQQYMQEPVTIMVSNRGKKEPVEVSPADMQGDMDLVVDEASMEPMTKEEQRNNYIAFTGQLVQMKQVADMQAQTLGTQPLALNFAELSEDLAENFGMKDFQKALISEEDLQMAQQQAQAQQAQMMQAGQQADPTAEADLQLKADKQEHDKEMDNKNFELEVAKFEQSTNQQNVNPTADQQAVDLAHELAQQGHIDPALLQHLPQLPPTPQELQAQEQAGGQVNG